MRKFPLQVWATRTFVGSWSAPAALDRPPVDTADTVGPLRAREGVLVGRITNNLPVDLERVALVYRGALYEVGDLVSGQSVRVEDLFRRGKGQDFNGWFRAEKGRPAALEPGEAVIAEGRTLDREYLRKHSAHDLFRLLLFHRLAPDAGRLDNHGLRTLDQSWRVSAQDEHPPAGRSAYREEAILIARTALVTDRAEAAARHGASPTRVWLGALPGEQPQRPELPGHVNQETYVRVFLPVQAANPQGPRKP